MGIFRIIGAAGIFVVTTLASCSKPKDLKFREASNLHVSDIGMDSSTLSLDLGFFNPNTYDIQLKNVNCDIFANKHFVGHYNRDSVFHIPGNANFTYPLKLRLDVKPILSNALSALFQKEILLEFKGTAKVGRSGFFITMPISFSKTQKLDFF